MSKQKKVKVDLPEPQTESKVRSMAEIQHEFSTLCARAGHLEYQIYTHEKDLELLNNQMRNLNFEAAAVKAKEDAKSKEEQKKEEQNA